MSIKERANFFHLVADIAWFGLAVAVTNRFLAFYAIRIGATPLEQGLIVSLPGLAMLFSTNFSAWWRRRHTTSVEALIWPSLLFRCVYLLPALTPFFPERWQPIWLVLSVTIPAFGQGIASIIFLIMMREAVNETLLTRLTSRRFLALNIGILASTVIFVGILQNMTFPQNYQVIFLLGFLFTLISQFHVMRVRVITPVPVQKPDVNAAPLWRSPNFLNVALVIIAGYVTFYSVFSVTPLHLVKTFGADEGFQAIFGTVELMAGVITAMFADRLVYRYSSRVATAMGLAGIALAALVFALSPSLHFTLIGAALSGGAWTVSLVALFSYFFQHTPAEDATRWTTAYQQLVSIATFAGPLIGSSMANWGVSLVIVLMVGAVLRLGAAAVIQYNALDTFIGYWKRHHPAPTKPVTVKR